MCCVQSLQGIEPSGLIGTQWIIRWQPSLISMDQISIETWKTAGESMAWLVIKLGQSQKMQLSSKVFPCMLRETSAVLLSFWTSKDMVIHNDLWPINSDLPIEKISARLTQWQKTLEKAWELMPWKRLYEAFPAAWRWGDAGCQKPASSD